MPYKYNPLLVGRLDRVGDGASTLGELDDVNTAGTANDKVLTFQSGTWIPAAVAGGGDMLTSVYVEGAGTVYNASRLAGDVIATVQAHNVAAGIITEGTIGLARVPAIDDARIPNLETLSYGGAFAAGQIPNLPTSKITTGTFNANRIPALPTTRITTGTFNLNRIPAVDDERIPNLETLSYGAAFAAAQIPDLAASKITSGTIGLVRIPSIDDARIPDLETLSYGAAFATAQIPSVGAYKITSGTLAVARHETLDNLNGTVALAQVPTMDDGHIPNVEGLSYGAAFATAQIPSVGAYKVASGTLGADRIPALPTARITSGTFNANRIPILPTDRYGSAVLLTGAQSIGGTKTFTDIPILPASDPAADNEAARKAYVDAQSGDIDGGIYSDTYVNTADIDGGTF